MAQCEIRANANASTHTMSSSHHQVTASTAAAAAAAAAAATTTSGLGANNQGLAAAAGHHQQAASLIDFHQRQQELIKLLTQHFHQQFYQQLAGNQQAATNDLHQQRQQQHYAAMARLAPAEQLATQYQQHYQAAHNLSAMSRANLFDQQQQSHQHLLANHILRSQQHQQHLDSGNSIVPSGAPLDPCGAFHNGAGPPVAGGGGCGAGGGYSSAALINDGSYNLFNALGLNLLNNHLVPRQQPAGGADDEPTSLRPRRAAAPGEQCARRGAPTMGANGGHRNLDDNDNEQGKELLKFSINTILATSNSPKSTSTILDETPAPHSNKQLDEFKLTGTRYIVASDVRDCDDSMVELESDSSSLGSASPAPPVPSDAHPCSILFNAQPRDHHHSAASFSSSNSLDMAPKSGQAPKLAVAQRQQQQPEPRQHQHQVHPPNTGNHSAALPFLANSATFPWTVAARGKPRRGMMRRAVFSDSQRVGLEKRFQLQKYISKPDRKKLAEKLGLRDSQVKIWFQNRRMKWRNSKERELLSAGGSREQTLPTRNNPNPDLSDVGETIKRIASSNTISAAANTSNSPTK